MDKVWKDRPAAETNPVIVHPIEFAGRSAVEKLKDLREKLTNEKACGMIITTLDEVSLSHNWPHLLAFIYNLRLKISNFQDIFFFSKFLLSGNIYQSNCFFAGCLVV